MHCDAVIHCDVVTHSDAVMHGKQMFERRPDENVTL
jgi:hypothetical protein